MRADRSRLARLAVGVFLCALAGTSARPAIAQDGGFPGVYVVHRVVTSSTCTTTAAGDTYNGLWFLERTDGSGFSMTVVGGTTSFRSFTGTLGGGTLTLTGTASFNTMTVTVTRDSSGLLIGTSTISAMSGERCSIVASIRAVPIGA